MSSDGAMDAAEPLDQAHSPEGRAALLHRLQRTLEGVTQGTHGELIDGLHLAAVEGAPVGRYTRLGEFTMQVLDRALATIGLVAISPVLLLLALAVKLDSSGPAFFRQTRIGRGGRPFTFYKFRGMYVDAKERFPHLYDYRYSQEEVQNLRFHPEADPRVTRVGHFIRRTSLDELPNLLNVVIGDMSLVGPRPEIPEMLPYYGRHANSVLTVKPGITSLAKCVGRDDLTFRETLELDLHYIRERELRMDLAILFGTVWKITIGRNVGH